MARRTLARPGGGCGPATRRWPSSRASCRAWERSPSSNTSSIGSAARVGWVQLANILGNAAGSIGTGIVTFHLLGTAGTLQLLAALSLLLVLGWLWKGGRGRRPEMTLAGACALTLVALPGNAAFWSRLHAEAPGHRVACHFPENAPAG